MIARTGALQAPTRLFSYLVTRGAVAIGFGKVWLGSNGLTTVDPATGQLHAPVPLPGVGPLVKGDPRPVGSGVVVGGGGVWATTPSGVALVNGRTGKLIDFIRVPGSVDAIALGNSSVWVADKLAGTITEIDPKTHTSGAPILLSGSIDSIAVGGGGYVWVMDTAGGIVTPIDPGNPSQHQAIRIGSDPVDITFGLGRVWVADQASGTIWRIDPVTKVADPFLHVGGAVVAVAVDEADHTLWVDIGPGGRRIT